MSIFNTFDFYTLLGKFISATSWLKIFPYRFLKYICKCFYPEFLSSFLEGTAWSILEIHSEFHVFNTKMCLIASSPHLNLYLWCKPNFHVHIISTWISVLVCWPFYLSVLPPYCLCNYCAVPNHPWLLAVTCLCSSFSYYTNSIHSRGDHFHFEVSHHLCQGWGKDRCHVHQAARTGTFLTTSSWINLDAVCLTPSNEDSPDQNPFLIEPSQKATPRFLILRNCQTINI